MNDHNANACTRCRDLLDRSAAGELTDAERRAVEAHIEACGECAREADEALAVDAIVSDAFARAALRPARREAPGLAELSATAMDEGRAIRTRRLIVRIGAAASVAAAVLLAVLLIPPLFEKDATRGPIDEGDDRGAPVVARTPDDPNIRAGLDWLAANQEADGHWDARRHGAGADFDVGLTGLAVLALVRGDETDRDAGLARARDRGIAWLLDRQKPDGYIAAGRGAGAMYGHAIATLALVEALDRKTSAALDDPGAIARAVAYCSRSQLPAGGWSYAVRGGPHRVPDTSHTGWFVLALRRAAHAGLDVPEGTLERARGWVATVTDNTGRVGYRSPHDGTPATTAIGLMVAEAAETSDLPAQPSSATLVRRMLSKDPSWTPTEKSLYFWHFVSRTDALRRADGAWTDALATSLARHQETGTDSPHKGSWPNRDRDSLAAGRVYSTAMAVVTLDSLRER
mgnify:CR=1 FL=1